MKLSIQHVPAVEVAWFRDPADTWFAAEVIRRQRWSEELLEPLDPELADIRIAFLVNMPEHPATVDWLCLLPATAEQEPGSVPEAALTTWLRAPAFRNPGPGPDRYLVAGYQALCPPHPPCTPGPGMRESLMEFLRDRSGALGRLGRECDDSVNRLLRLFWATPEAFAEEVLRARIRDGGGRGSLQLVDFLQAAEIAPEADELVPLERERAALLARLSTMAYFTQPSDYDRAAALAIDWRDRYLRAYRHHYRSVLTAAREMVLDTAFAARALPDLEAMNRAGRPVGADAVRRLRQALDVLAQLPEGIDERSAQTAGIVLGRMPHELAEARLAAAAVLAAVEVHARRRATAGLRGGVR
ncbi:MAG: hypothetical protein AB7F65_10205 [Dehalococcoidia bacterium]